MSGSSTAGINTQPSVVVTQGRRFERLRGRPERAGDPEFTEWVADMRYHLACNQMSKMAACALIMEHLRGKARVEISGRKYGTILRQYSGHCYKPLVMAVIW